jgi:hypothetical protein
MFIMILEQKCSRKFIFIFQWSQRFHIKNLFQIGSLNSVLPLLDLSIAHHRLGEANLVMVRKLRAQIYTDKEYWNSESEELEMTLMANPSDRMDVSSMQTSVDILILMIVVFARE